MVLGLALGVESPFIWWWSVQWVQVAVVSLVNGWRLGSRFVLLVHIPSQTNGSHSGLEEEPQASIMVGIIRGFPTDLTVESRQESNQ